MQSIKSARSHRRVMALAALGATLGLQSVHAQQPAQGAGPNRAGQMIKYRQALFTVSSRDFGWFNAMSRGQVPFDAAEAQKRAKRMEAVIGILPEAFPEDSQGEQSKAKPEIWTNKADFDALLQEFVSRAGKLTQAAAGGKEDEVKAAAKSMGEVCGQCHEKFKSR